MFLRKMIINSFYVTLHNSFKNFLFLLNNNVPGPKLMIRISLKIQFKLASMFFIKDIAEDIFCRFVLY